MLALGVALGVARAERVASEGYGALQARSGFGARPRGPRGKPRAVWTRELSMGGLTPPAFARDGRLVVGGEAGVVGLDGTGRELWSRRIGAIGFAPLPLGRDRFLVTTTRGRLWEVGAGGEVRAWPARFRALGAPVALDQGGVAFATDEGEVEIVDGSGAGLTRVASGLSGSLRLGAASGARVAVVGSGLAMSLVSLADGLLARSALAERAALAPLQAADGGLWLVGESGKVTRLGSDGRIAASITLGQPPVSAALGADGALRVTTQRSMFVCVAPDGTERWRQALDGRVEDVVLDADDTAYVVTRMGTLLMLDRDGAPLFRAGIAATEGPRPVIGPDGTLWIATRRGSLQGWR